MEWMDVLMWGEMKEEAWRMKEQAMHIQHSFTFIHSIQVSSLSLSFFLKFLLAVVTLQVSSNLNSE